MKINEAIKNSDEFLLKKTKNNNGKNINESILVKIDREIKTLLMNQFNQKFSDLSKLFTKNMKKDTIKPD